MKYEIIANGETTGIIIDADSQVTAKAQARKMGYKIASVKELTEIPGKECYDEVINYLNHLQVQGELHREDFLIDVASDHEAQTRDQKPSVDTVSKAKEYCKSMGLPFCYGYPVTLVKSLERRENND